MTDGDALYKGILAEPDDDTARLVYADFLDENGDPDRAEFIRVQISLANAGQPHKGLTYPDQPTAMKSHGDRHYSFTGYTDEGYEVEDRLDILVHRPRKTPKMVRGFRVYKIEPYTGHSASRGELDVYVRLDAGSGPWKGVALKKQEAELLAAHPEWSRLLCPRCHGKRGRNAKVNGGYDDEWIDCGTCGATGDLFRDYSGPVGVLAPSEAARTVTFRAGFPDSVSCTLGELGEWSSRFRSDRKEVFVPSPWAVAVVEAVPVRRFFLTDRKPSDYTGTGDRLCGFWGGEWTAHQEQNLPTRLWDVLNQDPKVYQHNANWCDFRTPEDADDSLARAAGLLVRESVYGVRSPSAAT